MKMTNRVKGIIGVLIVAIFAIVISTFIFFFSKNKVEDVNQTQNEQQIENYVVSTPTTNGDFKLNSVDIIKTASKLLGTPYVYGKKGVNTYQYTNIVQSNNLKTDSEVRNDGIDCTGLVYWTLSEIAKERNIDFGTRTSNMGNYISNITTNFSLNNPVPVDTLHWLTYWDGKNAQYVSEKYGTQNIPSITSYQMFGNTINVLKANESLTTKYYMYGGNKKLPAGTIVIMDATNANGSHDNYSSHAWITLGDLGTTNANDVINILAGMGIDRSLLTSDTVKSVNNTCTYWRIEAAGGNKVYINNGDYEVSVQNGTEFEEYTEIVNGVPVKRTKKIGTIWAFQISNDIVNKGSYKLNVNKKDENGNGLGGAQFQITKNGVSYTQNSEVGISKIGQEDTFVILETAAPTGYRLFSQPITVKARSTVINNTYKLDTVTSVQVGNQTLSQTSEGFSNGDVTVLWDQNNGVISVNVKDKKIIQGNYNLYVQKFDSETKQPMGGANFKITKGENGPEYNSGDNVSIKSNNQKDTFIIEEVTAPEGYKTISGKISVTVTGAELNGKYVLGTVADVKIGGKSVGKGSDGAYSNSEVRVDWDQNNGIVAVKVYDTKIKKGNYKLDINKYDGITNQKIGDSTNPLGGAEFTITKNDYAYTRNSNIEISKENQKDVFVITEDKAPSGYAKLLQPIIITVTGATTSDGNQYCLGQVESVFLGSTEIKRTDNGKGPFKSDEVEVNWDSTSGSVTVTVKDKPIVDLALKKTVTKVNGSEDIQAPRMMSKSTILDHVPKFGNENIDINDNKLSDGSDTNAVYSMNKTPVLVHIGDEVTYSIQIFNEGSVNARATEITDYIPVGLKVTSVQYINNKVDFGVLSQNDGKSGGYTYDETNGILKIKLDNFSNKQVQYIPAYVPKTDSQESVLSNDEIIVTCKVLDNAPRILTNIAEISAYTSEISELKDIDSTPNNWKNPNGDENNITTDKSTADWIDYISVTGDQNDSNDYLDGLYHSAFIAQDTGVNGYKGDDDDFDKLRVIKTYDVSVQKISNENNEKKLENIKFYIGNKSYSEASNTEKQKATKTTKTDGSTDVITKEISYTRKTNEEDVWYIKELELPAGSTYSKIDTEFELRIKKKSEGEIFGPDITKYSFGVSGTKASYTSITEPINVIVSDIDGHPVTITAKYNETEKRFIITVPNNVSKSQYYLQLFKVKANTQSDETEEGIEGIEFGINTQSGTKKTNKDGLISFGEYEITKDNYQKIDEFKITEIEDSNTRYYQLKNAITIYVKKDLDDLKQNYIVKEISLDGTNYSTTKITQEAELKDFDQKVNITVSLEGNIVTVKVPNILRNGEYELLVKKVDSKNETLDDVGFSLGNESQQVLTGSNGDSGIAVLVSGKKIGAENLNSVDKYTITETKSKSGYSKLKYPINIDVHKEDDGENFIVSYVDAYVNNGTPIKIEKGKYGTLNNVELENGSTVNVIIDLSETNSILVNIPNNELKGGFNLQVYKYYKKDGKEYPVPNISFSVYKNGDSSKQTKLGTTSNSGIITSGYELTKNDIGKTDKYTLVETVNKNDNYIGIAENIDIFVENVENSTKTKCMVSNAYFEGGATKKTVKLENGKTVDIEIQVVKNQNDVTTVKILVENTEVYGEYKVELAKKVNDNLEDGISFNVSKNKGDSTLYTTANGGKTIIANESITKENVGVTDEFVISEIETTNHRIIKVKNPLTLKVVKGINTTGTAGTQDAPGTKFVVKQFTVSGQGASEVKSSVGNQNNPEITVNGIVLDDGNIVDIIVKMTEEIDSETNNKYQKISLTIPNTERKGSYSLQIKKVNSSKNNSIISGAVFKIESFTKGNTNPVKTTDKTDGTNGTAVVESDIAIEPDSLDKPDTFKITEVIIYKNNSNNEETGYSKLKNPILLTIDKVANTADFDVKQLTLSQDGIPAKTGTSSVSLSNVELENGDKVTVRASIDSKNLITLTIPNKELGGSYSMDLVKTTDDFTTTLENMKFTYTGSNGEKTTNKDGLISNIALTTITKDNVDIVDNYEIKEVEIKTNEYLELVNPLTVKVEKTKKDNKFIVSKITLSSTGINPDWIIPGTNKNTAQLNGLETVKSGKTGSAKITFDESTQKIKLFVDNPKVEGSFSLKIKKVDNDDENKTLAGVKFGIIKRELITGGNEYQQIGDEKEVVTEANGYGYIYGDNPFTVNVVEPNENIEKNIRYIDITEKETSDGYELLKGIKISVKIETGLSSDGKSKIVKNATATVSRTIFDDETYERMKWVNNNINVTTNQNGTDVIVTIKNKKLDGKYNFKIVKVKQDGTKIPGIPFSVTKNGSTIKTEEKTSSDESTKGEIDLGAQTISEIQKGQTESVDNYVIKEIQLKNAQYICLSEELTVKVTTTENSDKTKYILKNISFGDSNEKVTKSDNGNKITVEKQANTIDGKKVNIKITADLTTNEIVLEIPNNDITGKFDLYIKKVDKNGGVKNVEFTVNGNKLNGSTNEQGLIKIDEKQINASNLSEDKYVINEIKVDSNNYIKLKSSLTLTISKGLNSDKTKYVVTKITLDGKGITKNIHGEGTVRAELADVALENGNTVTVTGELDENTQVITLTIPNEKIDGDYSVKIKKVNSDDSNENIKYAEFTANAIINNTEEDLGTVRTDGDGVKILKSVNIKGDTYQTPDKYIITETNIYKSSTGNDIDEGYIKIKDPIILEVKKTITNGKYTVSGLSLYQNGQTPTEGGSNVVLKNVKLENGESVDITAKLENGVINLIIPNKKVTGNYSLDLIKTTNNFQNTRGGFTFTYTGNPVGKTTDGEGKIIIEENKKIEDITNPDEYDFRELPNNKNKYLELSEPLKISIAKTKKDNKYVVSSITLSCGDKSVTLKSGEGSEAVLENIPTVKNGKTTSAKIVFDELTQKINLYVDNPEITGEYDLKIRKIDSQDENKTLQGVEFNVIKREQLETGGAYQQTKEVTAITQENGVGYIFGDNPYTTNVVEEKDEINRDVHIITINETKTVSGYRLLNDISIQLTIESDISSDGKTKIIKKVTPAVYRNSQTNEAFEMERLVREKLSVMVDNSGTGIVVTIPNENTTGFNFKVKKVDENDEILNGSKFTVKGPNDELLLDNQELTDGYFVKQYNGVKTNETYQFMVTENEAPEGYKNLLKGFDLRVSVDIGVDGKLDLKNSFIEVIPQTEDYDKDYYGDLLEKIKNEEINLSIEDSNTITLKIENEKVVKDYKFSLLKTELDSDVPLKGAQFKVIKNDEELKTFETNSLESVLIDDVKNITVGSSVEYEIEETQAPENYTCNYKKVKVVVNVDLSGNISAKITQIMENTVIEEWKDYDENANGSELRLNVNDDNTIELHWENPSTYTLYLFKEGYERTTEILNYSNDLIAEETDKGYTNSLPLLAGAKVSVTDEKGVNQEITTLGNRGRTFYKNDVKANQEYIYEFKELQTVDGYVNDFEGAKLVVHIRTDSNAKLVDVNQNRKNIYSYFEIIDETGTKTTEELQTIASKVFFGIKDRKAYLFMVNSKIEEPQYYKLRLWKIDDKTKEALKGAEFEIKMKDNNGETTLDSNSIKEGIQNFGTDNYGFINLEGLLVEQGTHTFTIKETKAPKGYLLPENLTITVTVNVGDAYTNLRNIQSQDVSVNVSGTEETVTSSVDDDGLITIVIPNRSSDFKFKLRKVDMDGNLIKTSVDENGTKQGTKLTFVANGDRIYDGTTYFDDGEYTYTCNTGEQELSRKKTYKFAVSEQEAKNGYYNILGEYAINVTVALDDNGRVLPVNPNDPTDSELLKYTSYSIIGPIDQELSREEVPNYVRLYITEDDEGVQTVTLEIINPWKYKLRLRKTDTLGNPLDKAILTADIQKRGEKTEEVRLARQDVNESGFVEIEKDETQTWIIDEIAVDNPYSNILLGDKALYINTKMVDGKLTYDYKVHDIIDGNEVIYGDDNEIYKFISVNILNENGNSVIDVQIKNPVTIITRVVKNNMQSGPINSAMLEMNGIKNINEDGSYNSKIEIKEQNVSTGEIKTFIVSELKTDAPYINVLGNNKIFVDVRSNIDGEVQIVGKGYIDENGVRHNGFGKFYKYVSVSVGLTSQQIVTISIKNPMEVLINVSKVDENGNPLPNAQLELTELNKSVVTNEITNAGKNDIVKYSDNIQYTTTDTKDYSDFIIREINSPDGYTNILKNKEIHFRVFKTPTGIAIGSISIYNITDNGRELIDESDDIYKDISLELIPVEESKTKIPTVNVKIANETDISLDIQKQVTNGVEYNGAEIELYELNNETNEKTLIKNNIINNVKLANITQNDIHVLPNKTYTYVIKEKSTTTPHVNILSDDKEIRLNVRLNKDETTGVLTPEYNYNLYDKDGNVLENDDAKNFITFGVDKNGTTGKYTFNVYIQNPVMFKMKFLKTDTTGKSIAKKAIITINGEQNNGSANKTYSNLKIGDTVSFDIGETSADQPFTNMLGKNHIVLIARVMENEQMSIVGRLFINTQTGATMQSIPSEIAKYLSAEFITDDEGIPTLDIKLQNPLSYKVKLTKQDMAGLGLKGTDIVVTNKTTGDVYENDGSDTLEFMVQNQKIGDKTDLEIREKSSIGNYENVFEGKVIQLQFNVNSDYTVSCSSKNMTYVDNGVNKTSEIPSKYFGFNIENNDEITVNIEMKNPIKYDLAIIKTDMSGNELQGDDLKIQVTKNSDEPISNNGKSNIKFEEKDLAPNTVNTYVIEELSTIAPHINELENKKLIVEVRVDEKGDLIVQKFDVIDKQTDQIINCEYVNYSLDEFSEDGTRLIKIIIKNPLTYITRVVKTSTDFGYINNAIISINDVTNVDTSVSPAVKKDKAVITETDVEIGKVKRYIISETETEKPYVNILGKNKLFVDVFMNSNLELEIQKRGYIDENKVEHEGFGEFEKYVQVSVYKDEKTKISTLTVFLTNPTQYIVRLYKVDSNNDKLLNTDIQITKNNGEIYTFKNDENGNPTNVIEIPCIGDKTQESFVVQEVNSLNGYNNNLKGKQMKFSVKATNNKVLTTDMQVVDLENSGKIENGFDSVSDYFSLVTKQSSETSDGIPVIEMVMKNTTDINLNIEKHKTNGDLYDGAEIELYELNNETNEKTLIKNNIVNNVKQSSITQNGINVVPNKTYTYVIKEKSTTTPHVNILGDDKEIRFNVRLNKNNDTSELVLDENLAKVEVYDKNGNLLVNDSSLEFIKIIPVKNAETGKYTINVYIENPLQFKMKFTKTDSVGNAIPGKAHITINGVENTGSAEQTYTNMKIGDTVEFKVKEISVTDPFVNTLNDDTLTIVARLMENEKLEVINTYTQGKSTNDELVDGITNDYFSYQITEENGIPVLDMKLENPVKFLFRLTKQDMAGIGLDGSDISVTYDGVTYSNKGKQTLEIPVTVDNINDSHTFAIRENSAKENYQNVFESEIYYLTVKINKDNDYKLEKVSCMKLILNGNKVPTIISFDDNKYISTTIDSDVNDGTPVMTVDVVMKNSIKYDFEVVKTDLSGNELSGDKLKIQVTRNSDEPKSNEGKSKIKFEERDLVPNTVNTYVIEELSTIAPHVNELENKKLTVQVRVDEKGGLVIQKLEVTDKTTGEIIPNNYIGYDDKAVSADGTRLIKIFIKNPISYRFKVIKTETQSPENKMNGTIPNKLEGASFQVNEFANSNGSSEINLVVNDVKIGDRKTFVITENSSVGAHDNILKNKQIILTTLMESDSKLIIASGELKDTVTGESVVINDEIKQQYRFDYDIVTDNDGFETVRVIIQNPVKIRMKVVKKDATGVQELSGAMIELKKDNKVVADNKNTGSAVLEYTVENIGKFENFTFNINENSSVSPNENILSGKTLVIAGLLNGNEKVGIINKAIYDTKNGKQVDLDNFVNVYVDEIDGIQTIVAEITNPVGYDLDLIKNNAGIGFLVNTKFQVYREGVQNAIFDGYVTDINTFKNPEVSEKQMKAGKYTYYITETKEARQRYVNILDGKYIKLNVEVDGTGKVSILNNKGELDQEYYEVYEGDISNRKDSDKLVDKSDLIYTHISVGMNVDTTTKKYMIKCNVTNPVRYTVELEKVDSVNNPLEGADFELVSEIIDSQNAVKTDLNKTVGVTDISEDGVVKGTTNKDGNISYEETFVMAGTYEYELKEIKTPGEQYVNPFDGYSIYFKVGINESGDIELLSYENGKNCYIVKTGTRGGNEIEATQDIYDYLTISRKNNQIIAKLEIEVENPVRYKFKLDKDIYGTENLPLVGAKFNIESSLIKKQGGSKTDMSKTTGVTSVAEDGVVSGTTNNDGTISFEETMVRPGIYEYWISEIETGDENVLNALQGTNIKIYVKVTSDGTIYTVTDDEQKQIIQGGVFYLYDSDRKNKIDFDKTSIDELIKVYVTSENNVNTIHVDIDDPQVYNFDMIKTDIDLYNLDGYLNYNMNDVNFEVKTYKENKLGEIEEINLKRGYDNTSVIDTSKLVTSTIDQTTGMISLKDILIESAGTYYFEFIETTPKDPIIYKDKSENVKVKVVIGVNEEHNKYVVENVEVVQGEKYVIPGHTKVEDSNVTVNITNERVKGSYDLEITKLDELLGHPLTGAKFVVEAFDVKKNELNNGFDYGSDNNSDNSEIEIGEQIELYKSDGDVTSMNKIIPGVLSIKNDNGTFKISNIRIENLKPYIIRITEIEAPETYTILRDPIYILVTPKIDGQFDDSKYVIDTVQLISGDNDGLVRLLGNSTDDKSGEGTTGEKSDDKSGEETKDEKSGDKSGEETKDEKSGDKSGEGTKDEKSDDKSGEEAKDEKSDDKSGEGTKDEKSDDKSDEETNDKLIKDVGNLIKIEIKNDQFDLALRKYISSINGKDVTRWTEPEIDTSKLSTGESTTAEYYNDKLPLRIYSGQEIIYTLRVYNEGQIDGYANKIVDHLPEQLEFLPDDEFNKSRGWKLVEETKDNTENKEVKVEETKDNSENKGVKIETDYLSKARNEDENVIKAFNKETGEIDYLEVQVKCKVKQKVEPKTYITNIAEITEYEGKNRPNVIDRDSSGSNADIPSGKDLEQYKQEEIEKQQNSTTLENKYIKGQEDDDDFEKVIVEKFDLALRKFITQVNDEEITTRIPEVNISEDGNISYEHDKTPLIVAHDNLVTYTLRIFNEGTVSGYATIVKDDIPLGLEFVPENETNIEYKWKMLDKDGNETKDPSNAVYVITDYLSEENGKTTQTDKETDNKSGKSDETAKNKIGEEAANKSEDLDETVKNENNKQSDSSSENSNLIKYFDKQTMNKPDYRDVKLVFRVNIPVRRDDVVINSAQITDDADDHGDVVDDDDSVTDVWNEGEDDQDREYIKVKYFDLALYKWVTEASVTEDGKTTVYGSNHTQDDKSGVVNVSIKKDKLRSVVVKFKYTIKVENQGNLSGYAKEIKDHIPAGLKFIPADNTEYGWEEQPDGTLINRCFENTLLAEGDTAETTIVLTWINDPNNLGQKINYAEISKDDNVYDSPDVDSTPNNFQNVPQEDDEDGDVVMLQIRTGIPSYVLIILATVTSMIIVAFGIYGIKEYVVND